MVDLARKNLLHDKLRFAITISGVAFAVTLVLVQIGLFLGLLDNATITIERIPADFWVTSKSTFGVFFVVTQKSAGIRSMVMVALSRRPRNKPICTNTRVTAKATPEMVIAKRSFNPRQ